MLGVSALVHTGLGFAVVGAESEHWQATEPKASLASPLRTETRGGDTFDVDAISSEGHAAEQVGASSGAPEPGAPQAPVVPPAVHIPAADSVDAPADSGARPSRPPRPVPVPVAAASALSGGPAAAPATDGAASETTGQRYGARGLPPGVRDLGSAFTRAIPAAVSRDPIWQEHAVGKAGSFVVRLELGSEGRVAESRLVLRPNERVPAEIERLERRVTALLGGGQFALPPSAGRQKVQLLLVEVELSDGAPRAGAAPHEVVELGFAPPNELTPGRAYFTLGSGRHFEANVTLLAAPD